MSAVAKVIRKRTAWDRIGAAESYLEDALNELSGIKDGDVQKQDPDTFRELVRDLLRLPEIKNADVLSDLGTWRAKAEAALEVDK